MNQEIKEKMYQLAKSENTFTGEKAFLRGFQVGFYTGLEISEEEKVKILNLIIKEMDDYALDYNCGCIHHSIYDHIIKKRGENLK